MKTPGETFHEDDVSGEAWFQKGVMLLEDKKQKSEIEEVLKKQMEYSAFQEPSFWIGILIVIAGAWVSSLSDEPIFPFLLFPTAGLQFFAALDDASKKRMKAMLEWMEYQKSKETPGS